LPADSAIDVLLKPHANNPKPLLQALGMSIPTNRKVERRFVEIMTAECKPERRIYSKATHNGVGAINPKESKDSNPYTCVGNPRLRLHPARPGAVADPARDVVWRRDAYRRAIRI